MFTKSLSEIIKEAAKQKTKKEKVAILQQYSCRPLRDILQLMYNKNIEFNIPLDPPPFTPTDHPSDIGMLYSKARILRHFVKGLEGDNLTTIRREGLFIEMLEVIHSDDAELILDMVNHRPVNGLTIATINAAFGENFIPPKEKKSNVKKK